MISDKHRRRNRGENGRIPTSLLLVPRPDHPSRLGSTSRQAELRVILVACLMVPFASFLDGSTHASSGPRNQQLFHCCWFRCFSQACWLAQDKVLKSLHGPEVWGGSSLETK